MAKDPFNPNIDSDWVVSHLFVAAPQLFVNDKTIRRMRDLGLLTDESVNSIRRSSKKINKYIRGTKDARSIVERILAINPGQLDEDFVNLLRLGNFISKSQAHQMRLMIRSQNALVGRRTDKTIMTRFLRLFGVGYSEESINLMGSLGLINRNQSEAFKSFLLASKVTAETLRDMRHAKNFLDMFALVGDGLVDARTIRAMQYSGMVSSRTAERLIAAVNVGKADWQAFRGVKGAEGYVQRLLYTVSGSFNHETLKFLRLMNIITRREELLLRIPVQIGLEYNRYLQEKFTNRRFRPKPGEAPIKTFARASKKTDADLLRLLSQAADESYKSAKKLDNLAGIGSKARSNQLKAVAKELHDEMQALWEGNGYLTIFGQHEVARASRESNEFLMRKLLGKFTEEESYLLGYRAQAGIDAYISRSENAHELSRPVYKNIALYNGKVDQRIDLALLKGQSANELARDISQFINPKVPGGVRYAAMRLARTELNNAFHLTSQRYTRDMPWVNGYQWHLSGSHRSKAGDQCEPYANDDHGLGKAGLWKKYECPAKPHPNCFCFITPETVDEDTFFDRYERGFYNRYLKDNAYGDKQADNSWLYDKAQGAFSTIGG